MKRASIYIVVLVLLLATTTLWAQQPSPTNSNSSDTAAPTKSDSTPSELEQLKAMVMEQQKQLAEQQKQIQDLQKQVQPVAATSANTGAVVANASLNTSAVSRTVQPASDAPQKPEEPKPSPLYFKIGGAEFTPGGFVDFENIWRSTNTGFVTATNFWAIPFSNSVAGHLTEYRSTGQYSRFNLNMHGKLGETDLTGYLEFDFNGNDAANVFVSSNPHTNRIRVYYLDVKRGKWELVGGQPWGLQTPHRVGLGPSPGALMLTTGEDAQVHVGVNYTRAGEFRAIYHFSDRFGWAVAIQNPQQFGGQGELTFPQGGGFNAQLLGQFDQAATPGAPNVGPDILTKLAFDSNPKPGQRNFHLELGAMETAVKITNLVTNGAAIGQPNFVHTTMTGGGVFGGISADLFNKNSRYFRFVGYGMWGPGVGRYLIGMAPQAIAVATNFPGGTPCNSTGAPPGALTAGANCTVSLSPVHSGDMIVGLEFAPAPKSQFGVYYGGMYAQRNFAQDLTGGIVAATGLHPFIGFGWPGQPTIANPAIVVGGSGSNNNRAVQEGTVDFTQTLWRNPNYGALLLVNQASYVTRAPWFVAAGAPKNAHLMMAYVSLRYVLP
jgi:hypothetical protein